MYYNASGPLSTAGATTTLVLPVLGTPGNTLFPAQSVTLSITNPTGVGQTITSGSLLFTQTVGGGTTTITYNLTSPSIAAGANQVFEVSLTSGVLANVKLSVTFGGTPTAGTLNVTASWNRSIS